MQQNTTENTMIIVTALLSSLEPPELPLFIFVVVGDSVGVEVGAKEREGAEDGAEVGVAEL